MENRRQFGFIVTVLLKKLLVFIPSCAGLIFRGRDDGLALINQIITKKNFETY